jgi:hypothetical protein
MARNVKRLPMDEQQLFHGLVDLFREASKPIPKCQSPDG